MKILLVAQGHPPELCGGTESYTAAVAVALQAAGHESLVVAGTLEKREPLQVEEAVQDGVRVLRVHRDDLYFERWDKSYHPGVSRAFAEIVDRERPDLVHVNHWLRLSRDLVRQAWRLGVPSIVTLHDFFATCPTIFRLLPDGAFCREAAGAAACGRCLQAAAWWSERELGDALDLFASDLRNELQLAGRVLVQSRAQREVVRAAAGLDSERVTVQPFAPLRRLRRAPEPPPPPPLRLVCFGLQDPIKGTDLLLEAVAAMRRREDVEVELAGATPDAAYGRRLDELARGLRVRRVEEIRFSELERSAFHAAVFPSRCHETYGMVLDEARMLGLPAVVADLGAYPERLDGGGITFPSGDATALAAVLERLLEEPQHLTRMRAAVTEPPTFEEHLAFLLPLYKDVVAEGPRAAHDAFDVERHLQHAFDRFEARERLALRSAPPREP